MVCEHEYMDMRPTQLSNLLQHWSHAKVYNYIEWKTIIPHLDCMEDLFVYYIELPNLWFGKMNDS